VKDIQVLIGEEDANVVLRTNLDTLPPLLADALARIQANISSAVKAAAFKNAPLVDRMALAKKKRVMKKFENMGASEGDLRELSNLLDNMTPQEVRDF
jgi:hypothetical protein